MKLDAKTTSNKKMFTTASILSNHDLNILSGLKAKEQGEVIPPLIESILNFDIAYNYSDDINGFRSGNERKKQLIKEIDESSYENKAELMSAITDLKTHTALHDKYPSIYAPMDYNHYLNSPSALGLHLRKASDITMYKAKRIAISFISHLKRRVFTFGIPYTPSAPGNHIVLDSKVSVSQELYNIVQKCYEFCKDPDGRDVFNSAQSFTQNGETVEFRINNNVLIIGYEGSYLEIYLS